MRNRDIFLPSLSTLLIFGMAIVLSCAHQNRVKDGLDAQADESGTEQASVSEEGTTTEKPPTDDGALTELAQNTGDPADKPLENGELEATTQKASEDADLKALGVPQDEKPLEQATTELESQKPVTDTVEALSPEAEKTASQLDPITGLEPAATGSVDTALEKTPPPAEQVPQDSTLSATEAIPATAPIEEPAVLKNEERHRRTFSRSSRVPKIPFKAVKRAGTSLNRFYFLRQGDTPESVSTLIYGNSEHAKSLAKWNGKGWEAGKLVFYSSPIDASEKKMRSFYQEKNVQPEEYTIQRGDWLSKIAKKNLGAAKSWKEVAVVNGLASPDSIEVGQKIALYPKDLSGYSGQQQPVAEKVEEPEKPVAVQQPPEQQPIPPQTQVQPPDPNLEQQNPAVPEQKPVAEEPKKVQKQQAVDPSKLIEQNLPAVAILGLVAVLSGLYLVVRKKKTSKSLDEFNDDNFAPPTKLKRK